MAVEDFTTYTEADPGADLTVTATKVAAVALPRNVDAWVYNDKGASHFGATFAHKHEYTQTAGATGFTCVWAVSNVVEDFKYWDTNNSQAVAVRYYGNTGLSIRDEESPTQDDAVLVSGTHYYTTTTRINETDMKHEIWDDPGRTNLIDTIFETIPSGRRYQYVFACDSYNSGNADTHTIDIENLDLQEAPPSFVPYPHLHGLDGGMSTLSAGSTQE